jgi:cystathionine beta-synthase
MRYNDTLELIGNTPIVKIKSFDTGKCELYLKLETQNPGGSIKDRIGLSMIESAEKEGKIKPGDTLIEATAGNTGLGLALTAAKKGYKLLLVIPDKMSQEKVSHLKAMGAEIIMTRSDVEKGHPEYYQDYALRLSKEIPNSYFINQFNNPSNPRAHETTTGPEIWEQMEHDVDAIVVAVGSSGTLGGLSRYFKKVKPDIDFVLADPEGSVLKDYYYTKEVGPAGSWLTEGIGEDFVPPQFDESLIRHAYTISDKEAFLTARKLLREEGIFAGSSTGVLVAGAVRYAQEQKSPKKIVTFACDSGNKYLSKMYNDYWMLDNGFIEREKKGDLTDIITRAHDERAVVTAKSEDTLFQAYSKMKLYGISQLPVLHDDKVIGIIDEYDILIAFEDGDESNFGRSVQDFMTANLETLKPGDSIKSLISVLKNGYTAIICDDRKFYGIITKIDYINYIRNKRNL